MDAPTCDRAPLLTAIPGQTMRRLFRQLLSVPSGQLHGLLGRLQAKYGQPPLGSLLPRNATSKPEAIVAGVLSFFLSGCPTRGIQPVPKGEIC